MKLKKKNPQKWTKQSAINNNKIVDSSDKILKKESISENINKTLENCHGFNEVKFCKQSLIKLDTRLVRRFIGNNKGFMTYKTLCH